MMRAERYRWPISPLALRILGVNVVALAILGGGILYLAQFEDNLIQQRMRALWIESEIIADALGESATGGPNSSDINPVPARSIIGRLVGPTMDRGRLFDLDGTLIADSRLPGPDRQVDVQVLPHLDRPTNWGQSLPYFLVGVLDGLRRQTSYPTVEERPDMTGWDFSEVSAAMSGEPSQQIRRYPDGTLMLTVARPVLRFRQVLGVFMLSADTSDIETIVRQEQVLILTVFAGSLAITLLLTLFLAGTIALPIRRLALAAEKVRNAMGREEHFPEFSRRRDEIGDLSRSLAAMTRALYRQIGAIESFAADVSHELKNPLSSLRSAVDSLRLTDKADVREKLLTIIQDDVKRLDRLITDISDASRLDAELLRSVMEPVDLIILINTLMQASEIVADKAGVTFRLTQADEKPFIVGGLGSRLGQVISNLLDNAVSFSSVGGCVHLHLARESHSILLTVDDGGPGLPEGAADKIFDRFYSERPSQEAFGTHSGLGLSISRQIVEAHGGTLTASNRLDERGQVAGARFTMALPRLSRA